jgi:bacterioferritin-associated ferredoxin
MPVDRCVCHQVRFSRLLEVASEVGRDFDALARTTNCGSGCGMCVPYIRLMLMTGKTSLPVMKPEDIKRMLQDLQQPA